MTTKSKAKPKPKAKAEPAETDGVCRVCGCTDEWGCDVGCCWVNAEHTLCSECVDGKA